VSLNIADGPRAGAIAGADSTRGLPELVSSTYDRAPAPVRTKLIEYLLGPVGPLALIAIANGAFVHFLYRAERNAVPVSVDDAATITSGHVLELARYVEQSSPEVLLPIGSLIAERPVDLFTIGGSALFLGLLDCIRPEGRGFTARFR
jgi:hypothetical protein